MPCSPAAPTRHRCCPALLVALRLGPGKSRRPLIARILEAGTADDLRRHGPPAAAWKARLLGRRWEPPHLCRRAILGRG